LWLFLKAIPNKAAQYDFAMSPLGTLVRQEKVELNRRCPTQYQDHEFHIDAQERVSLKIQECVFDVAEDNDIEPVLKLEYEQ